MIPLISSLLKTLLLVVIGNLDSVSHFPPLPCFNQRQLDTELCFSFAEEWFEDDFNDRLRQRLWLH